jgi:hypothetical protein
VSIRCRHGGESCIGVDRGSEIGLDRVQQTRRQGVLGDDAVLQRAVRPPHVCECSDNAIDRVRDVLELDIEPIAGLLRVRLVRREVGEIIARRVGRGVSHQPSS